MECSRVALPEFTSMDTSASVWLMTMYPPDLSVTVAPDKLSAVADVVVQVQAGGDKDFRVLEMKFTFQKIGGDWLITRVETIRTVS